MIEKLKKNLCTILKIASFIKIVPKTLKLIYSFDKKGIIILSFLNLLKSTLPILSAFIFGMMINTLYLKNFDKIISVLILYVTIKALADFITVISTHVSRKIQSFLDYKLVKKTMEKCSKLSLMDFENSKVQDMLQHIQSQISYRPYQMFNNIISILTSIVTLTTSLYVFISFFKYVSFILIVPFIISTIFYLLLCDEEFKLEEKRCPRSRSLWYIEYLLTKDINFKEIRLFGLSKYLLDKYNRNKKIIVSENIKVSRKRSILTAIFDFINNIMSLIMLIIIVLSMCNNVITVALAISLIRTLSIFYSSCRGFGDSIYGIYQNSLYMQKLFNFLDLKEDQDLKDNKLKLPSINTLEVKNLKFSYNRKNLVLDNINFKIKKGERVALFGVNGSGKSTLIKLILSYYNVENNMILFNDKCINTLDKKNLYKKISVLFQDFIKYELSLRENIGFGNIDNIKNNVKLNNTKNTVGINFVKNLDQQLGLWFDEGTQLSGGQWQKIAIARALFNDADIYILDEPSSALDKINENKLINYFIDFTKDKIGLFISHKISNAMKADKIIFIDHGKIVNIGSHEFLLKNCSLYKKIYNLEFGKNMEE